MVKQLFNSYCMQLFPTNHVCKLLLSTSLPVLRLQLRVLLRPCLPSAVYKLPVLRLQLPAAVACAPIPETRAANKVCSRIRASRALAKR